MFENINVKGNGKTPPPGVEPGSPEGPALKAGAIPLCDGGVLFMKIIENQGF